MAAALVTGNFLLDWAAMALSLFNPILMTWLGLTVILNAEQRRPGVWVVGSGLLLAGLFFVSHTALISLNLHQLDWFSALFWTLLLTLPLILLPYTWYVVMLWYSGYWYESSSALRRRQRPWLLVVSLLLLFGLLTLFALTLSVGVSQPHFGPLFMQIRFHPARLGLLFAAYFGYLLLCMGLSLDAVRRPGPSQRVMGAQARERARPWLIAATVTLILVSVLVALFAVWIMPELTGKTFSGVYLAEIDRIARVDVVAMALITLVVLCLGQAMVSYEVFTGKSLPRRGLARHWQRVILLAAGYAVLVGAAIVLRVQVVYLLLLSTLLMTIAFALVSWRSYREREAYFASLRPFITSQRLFDQLTVAPPSDTAVRVAYRALCQGVLDASHAVLAPLGALLPLVGAPLVYPDGRAHRLPALDALAAGFQSPQSPPQPVDAAQYAGAIWAVALWGERGLIGLLLVGPKQSGGLYTQEEMELARITAERLIDARASAEMAQRLMALQRERLAQTQVIDQQTRRTLHDEILPTLQTATMLLKTDPDTAVVQLSDVHRQIANLLRDMPTTSAPDVARLGLVAALQRAVELEFAAAFDAVHWQAAPRAAERARAMPTLTAEVVFYAAREAVRNAAKYGRGTKRPFALTVSVSWQDGLEVTIEDNGVGIEAASDDVTDGSGLGLALHSTMLAVVGGTLTVSSQSGRFTRVTLKV